MKNEPNEANPWDADQYSDNTGTVESDSFVSAAASIVGNLKHGSSDRNTIQNRETNPMHHTGIGDQSYVESRSSPESYSSQVSESEIISDSDKTTVGQSDSTVGINDLVSQAEKLLAATENRGEMRNLKRDNPFDSENDNMNYNKSSTISNFEPSFTDSLVGSTSSFPETAPSRSTTQNSKDSHSDVSSVHGPMWRAAQQLLVEDEKEEIDEERAVYEKFEEQRRRHNVPKSLKGVHAIESVKKFKHEIEQRSELREKKKEISDSLLSRTKTRADACAQTVVKTAVPPSLFRAAQEKDIRTIEEIHDIPQHHGVRAAASSDVLAIVDESKLIDTNPQIARRRARVIQLFLFGLLGTVAGLSGSVFAQFSCHFASAEVLVGDRNNGTPFKMHFGMWKYTPIDSIFQGYSYCYSYDDDYASSQPYFARTTGIAAAILGTFALSVLWAYIIFGQTRGIIWKIAAYSSLGAFFFQLFTFTFFLGNICRGTSCSFGPGAIISVMTTVIWLFLSYEMFSNLSLIKKEGGILPKSAQNGLSKDGYILEDMRDQVNTAWNQTPFKAMTDEIPSLSSISKKRTSTNMKDEIPSLSALSKKSQRGRDNRGDIEMQDSYGSYNPPGRIV